MIKNKYISTVAFINKSIEEIIEMSALNDFSVEFSSGIQYQQNLESLIINFKGPRLIHNYCPPPLTPFVINLASSDKKLREKSIEHCKKGLLLSKSCNATFFAAHAGFCLDPKPEMLGHKLDTNIDFDKDLCVKNFIDSLEQILILSDSLNVDFYIENNVIASCNLKNGNINPLLCTESNEIIFILNHFNKKNFGLLLDTGHLKVSSNSLGLDLESELNQIKPYIKAIHHSDNNGKVDSNSIIDENYWFLKHIKEFSNLPNVIEVKDLDIPQIINQFKILESGS
jgi:sugar phosphate isomerase/epimerase